jgi:broad specificity phosphatase PhoE
MLLHCIRHGETLHNAEGRVQGQSDVPLSELGRRQGQAVAEALDYRQLGGVFSSPLKRALETAEIIAQTHRLKVRIDRRLMEIHAGVFQNRLRSEIEDLFPEAIARWRSGDPDFVIPGGESQRQLAERGCQALAAICRSGLREAAVVAHGRLLTVTLKSLLGIPPAEGPQSLQNGSITTVEMTADGRVELLALDQIEHLKGVGLSGQGDL